MYLMYKPDVPGFWVALKKLDWTFSEAAVAPWYGPTTPQPAPAPASTPMGAAAFPGWSNTARNFIKPR
jgi:hypothetical protein